MKEIDFNGSGDVDYTGAVHFVIALINPNLEFVLAAMNKDNLLSQIKVKQAFQAFDLVQTQHLRKLMSLEWRWSHQQRGAGVCNGWN